MECADFYSAFCLTSFCQPNDGNMLLVFFHWLLDFGRKELSIQPCDVGYRNMLGTFGLAGVGVRAVAEPQLVHLGYHGLRTALGLHLALWQQCHLRHFGGDKKHGTRIFTGRHTCATSYAGSRVHSKIGIVLGYRYDIAVGHTSRMARHIATRLNDFVESRPIHCQVLDNGESG